MCVEFRIVFFSLFLKPLVVTPTQTSDVLFSNCSGKPPLPTCLVCEDPTFFRKNNKNNEMPKRKRWGNKRWLGTYFFLLYFKLQTTGPQPSRFRHLKLFFFFNKTQSGHNHCTINSAPTKNIFTIFPLRSLIRVPSVQTPSFFILFWSEFHPRNLNKPSSNFGESKCDQVLQPSFPVNYAPKEQPYVRVKKISRWKNMKCQHLNPNFCAVFPLERRARVS